MKNIILGNNKKLWNIFENQILVNNEKLKCLIGNNLNLFQTHREKYYSNLACAQDFLLHIDEFSKTRGEEEKTREVLFPEKINSIFGLSPIKDSLIPSTESLESLIMKLNEEGKYIEIVLGTDNPHIKILEEDKENVLYLEDTPRIRQLYNDYRCFRPAKFRLESLNFAYKYLNSHKIKYRFSHLNNLREIYINEQKLIFVYEYCLSKISLMEMCPEENSVVVNLHNWNGKSCISDEAYEFAETINATLLTIEEFYVYVKNFKRKK